MLLQADAKEEDDDGGDGSGGGGGGANEAMDPHNAVVFASYGLRVLCLLLESQYSHDQISSLSLQRTLSRTSQFVLLAVLDACLGVSGWEITHYNSSRALQDGPNNRDLRSVLQPAHSGAGCKTHSGASGAKHTQALGANHTQAPQVQNTLRRLRCKTRLKNPGWFLILFFYSVLYEPSKSQDVLKPRIV